MKKLVILLLVFFSVSIYSHTINYENQVLHHWSIVKKGLFVDGSFSMMKNGEVYIEDAQNNMISFPVSQLSQKDQRYVAFKQAQVKEINALNNRNEASGLESIALKISGIVLLLIVTAIGLFRFVDRAKYRYLAPVFFIGILSTFYSFTRKALTTTDPDFINAAFTPFIPNVATSWDNTYFYVESKGIPSHTMMVGISNHGWQQQVPIPQCYIGNNHWSIPLNPVVSSSPIAVDNIHFTRGAIAIAANGVPIFNYHTNTGVDSYLDGQLDNYGGHCGRGDDYHYHIAPLHLYTAGQTTTNLPCAFALDGFAVYGGVEPDGSAMAPLDTNHGHFGIDGVYHYHGTATAPYMIGSFKGQVTEDATYQLIPQAAAHPVRTENWTPLSGALITSCVGNANTNGYNLSYTLNGVPGYATNFSWSGTNYTFNYVTPTATTTQNYNGFNQCTVPLSNLLFTMDTNVVLHPNPAKDYVHIQLGKDLIANDIKSVVIYSLKGNVVLRYEGFRSDLDLKSLASGTYIVSLQMGRKHIDKKMIIE
jgi:hypothetical protein